MSKPLTFTKHQEEDTRSRMLGRYLLNTSRICNPDLSEPTQTEMTTLSFDDSSQTCLEHIMECPHSSLRYINLWIPRIWICSVMHGSVSENWLLLQWYHTLKPHENRYITTGTYTAIGCPASPAPCAPALDNISASRATSASKQACQQKWRGV